MNKNITFSLLFIALFMFSSQGVIIHLKHHQISSINECPICQAAKYSEEQQHQHSPIIYYNQNSVIEQERIVIKQITKESYPLIQLPLYRLSDFHGYKQRATLFLSLGYFATAPPYFS